jgi:hypothetical protein
LFIVGTLLSLRYIFGTDALPAGKRIFPGKNGGPAPNVYYYSTFSPTLQGFLRVWNDFLRLLGQKIRQKSFIA